MYSRHRPPRLRLARCSPNRSWSGAAADERDAGLIEAARKEGKIAYYFALELNAAERLAKAFEAKYPGIAVRVERSGAERILQRIAQEQAAASMRSMSPTPPIPPHYLDWK